MIAYFCSMFGDISIEQIGSNVILKTSNLSIIENRILHEIIRNYKYDIPDEQYQRYLKSESIDNFEIELASVKLEDVHKFMRKKLKKDKPTLTALKFKDGRIELSEEIRDEATKAVTTDKPNKGCPMPIVLDSEIRASRVLSEFLTEEQKRDYTLSNSIVSIGNFTSHPYLIISRWSPKVEIIGQLYDLVDKKTICASCKEIPPSEEILALKLSVELNEREFLGI